MRGLGTRAQLASEASLVSVAGGPGGHAKDSTPRSASCCSWCHQGLLLSKTLPECPWPTSTHPPPGHKRSLLCLHQGPLAVPVGRGVTGALSTKGQASQHPIHRCSLLRNPRLSTLVSTLLKRDTTSFPVGTFVLSNQSSIPQPLPLGLCALRTAPSLPLAMCLEGVASWAGRRPRAKAPNPTGGPCRRWSTEPRWPAAEEDRQVPEMASGTRGQVLPLPSSVTGVLPSSGGVGTGEDCHPPPFARTASERVPFSAAEGRVRGSAPCLHKSRAGDRRSPFYSLTG